MQTNQNYEQFLNKIKNSIYNLFNEGRFYFDDGRKRADNLFTNTVWLIWKIGLDISKTEGSFNPSLEKS